MGGLVIETVRPGVQFTPDAAAAFRRAEAQVQRELGRGIDANSTYRSWSQQMSMYNAWNAYAAGRGPYPGHSKAVHPSESFHVSGLALDSDDWRNARIVQILADNGFIRNRLYVPNEEHHFEYIRSRDKNYGKTAGGASKPAPKPADPIIEEDENMPVIITNSAKNEWSLLDPDIGKDQPRFTGTAGNNFRSEKVTGGVVNTYRGFMVTTSKAVADAWGRSYCRAYGNAPQQRLGGDYKNAQVEASRLASEKHR